MGKEQYLPDKSGKIERGAGIVRNGALAVALLGLIIASPGLLVGGGAGALGGEIVRRHEKSKRERGG